MVKECALCSRLSARHRPEEHIIKGSCGLNFFEGLRHAAVHCQCCGKLQSAQCIDLLVRSFAEFLASHRGLSLHSCAPALLRAFADGRMSKLLATASHEDFMKLLSNDAELDGVVSDGHLIFTPTCMLCCDFQVKQQPCAISCCPRILYEGYHHLRVQAPNDAGIDMDVIDHVHLVVVAQVRVRARVHASVCTHVTRMQRVVACKHARVRARVHVLVLGVLLFPRSATVCRCSLRVLCLHALFTLAAAVGRTAGWPLS